GLAGVMGGANSEMTDATTDVLLESATFNAANNRRTGQALGMPTEASARFEKGLSPDLAPLGLARATQLIQQIAGGTVAKGMLDVFPAKDSVASPILLRMDRLEKVLGVSFPMERVVNVLVSLGFEIETEGENSLKAKAPYWRGDISIEDDLVEEIARIVGYEAIPTTMLSTPIPPYLPQPMQQVREGIRDQLVALGMQEIITYSLTNLEELSKTNALDGESQPLRVANPLSSQHEHLRTTLRSGLLSTAGTNLSQGNAPVSIFESGHVYLPRAGDLPAERDMVAGALCGPRWEAHWLEEDEPMGFLDAKGVLERLFERLGAECVFAPSHDPMLSPGTCAEISVGDTSVGIVGEVNPSIAASFQVEGYPLAFFELDAESIVKSMPPIKYAYKPIYRFPAAVRDLSVIVEQDVPSAQVQEIIQRQRLVERVQLFDVYEGDNIPAGSRSLAYHIYFQASDRTLTSDEVQKAFQSIIRSLEQQVKGELRA
ncbi:MAG: phenylalanine--tRNA ligase subunit beta, partial [Dehalococcoidia bacterium]|nr:phenylalanine--tRNA ligase subunit beta [Dehalococcoidia bacterium]